jgi:hypothetical protein
VGRLQADPGPSIDLGREISDRGPVHPTIFGSIEVQRTTVIRPHGRRPGTPTECGFGKDVRTRATQGGLKPWLDSWKDGELRAAGWEMRRLLEAAKDGVMSSELKKAA